jgi:hypothetical protein
METVGHIIERFVIHFFSATGLVLSVATFLRYAKRKKSYNWLPEGARATVIWAALVVFAASTMREAYDVSVGGWVVKSYFDYASWALGCGIGAWGIIRSWEWAG